jgi:O-antigen/teichoic acid export membrane protein
LPFASIWGVLIYEIAEQQQAKKIYSQVFQYFNYGQMLLFLGVSLFAKPLLALIASPAFAAAEGIIPVVCLAYFFYSLHEHFKVPALLAKRTLSLLPAFITAAVINIIANLALIPLLGLQGAAWASVLSFAVFSFLGLWRYRLIDKYDYSLFRCGAILAGMIVSYLGARFLGWWDLPKLWLLAISGFIWLGWAVLLFGREASRLALAGAKLWPRHVSRDKRRRPPRTWPVKKVTR